jgi:AraC-like DNA-binding protein
LENSTRIIRNYSNINFRYTKGKIDIFLNKQFHHCYEIYLLLDGDDIEFINDHTREKITPNSLVIIPPGEYHRFIVAGESADIYERCILNICPEFLGGAILEDALGGKELLYLTSDDRIVENFLYLKDAMIKNSENDFGYILSAIATDIVFLIKQNSNSVGNTANNYLHPISFQIMDYINNNYKNNITLSDIAKNFFLSVSSISHIFKDEFGVSIKKYIIGKRMNEIRISLQNGKRVQEVSEEFGFSNYSTFYRSYCKHFGIPPSHTKNYKIKAR